MSWSDILTKQYHASHVPQTFSTLTLNQDYDPMPRAFRVAASGNVAVVNAENDLIIIKNMQVGEIHRGLFKRIELDGTTVTDPETNITVYW